MISLPFKILTFYSSCLLNLGHCLLPFINEVALNVMYNILHYVGKETVI